MSKAQYSTKLFTELKGTKEEIEQQKVDLKATIIAAKLLTDTLNILIENRVESIRTQSESKKKYTSAAWAYEQADANGEIRGLKFLLDLFPKV